MSTDADFDPYLYREAFGLACRLAEARVHDMASGRERRNTAAGASEAAILAEVARQLGVKPASIRSAVARAVAGEAPVW